MVSHFGFRSQTRVPNLKCTGQMACHEWHTVGPQPAYKAFEDILIVLLGSVVAE